MYLYSTFYIFIYLIVQKIRWMPCWVHTFWSLIFNTHGNWGCESNRPYVSLPPCALTTEVSDVSFSFGAGVAIGRAWVWSSNIFKFTVKISRGPSIAVENLWFVETWIKNYRERIHIPPMDKENRLWLGTCDGFPGGSLTRRPFEQMPKGMAWDCHGTPRLKSFWPRIWQWLLQPASRQTMDKAAETVSW